MLFSLIVLHAHFEFVFFYSLKYRRYSTSGFAKNKDFVPSNQLIESLSLSSYIRYVVISMLVIYICVRSIRRKYVYFFSFPYASSLLILKTLRTFATYTNENFAAATCSFCVSYAGINLCSSPSSLTGKKSNEIILGGLNSLKSAATTVVKKFDEIKEAISATSTPVKIKEREQKLAYGVSHESLDSLTDGSLQDRNEVSTRATGISQSESATFVPR